MSRTVSRRQLVKAGLGAAAGLGALGAGVRVADRCGLVPANHRGIYGLSETLTYAGQRLLTRSEALARRVDGEGDRRAVRRGPPLAAARRRFLLTMNP
jgi:hypothetical protein